MPSPLSVLIVVAFFGLLALVVYNDVRELRIPNGIPLSLLALYPAYVLLAAPGTGGWLAIAIAGGVLVLGMAAFAAELVGGGDVKLLAVLTLWAGPASVVDLMVITAFVGGGMAVLMLSPLRHVMAGASDAIGATAIRDTLLGRHLPYGGAIAAGAAVSISPGVLALIR